MVSEEDDKNRILSIIFYIVLLILLVQSFIQHLEKEVCYKKVLLQSKFTKIESHPAPIPN